ncbi:hypothetical protein GC175_30085 [bacterium]|nr:hypothetical protein [bacterium]
MSGKRHLANGSGASQPNHYSSFIASSFTPFRLFFIPAFTLTHGEHGPIWGSLVFALALTFGGEWLARQRTSDMPNPQRDLLVVAASLFLIGLFPEETPIQLILWTGIGLAWGNLQRHQPQTASTTRRWIGYVLGAALGLTGLVGPGSWLMAGVVILGFAIPRKHVY